MQLSGIRKEIRNITGVDDKSVVADSVLNDLINKGQTILADDANLFYGSATRNSINGTGEYQIISGNGISVDAWTVSETIVVQIKNLAHMIRIYRVDYDGNQTTRIGMDQIHNISSDLSDLNIPTAYSYYINDLSIGIFPIPSAAKEIKIYYYHLPAALASDGDIPLIDSRYHESLVYYGCWKVVERLRDINLIPYFKNEWNEWKEKVVLDRQRRAGEPKITLSYKDF